MAKKEPVFLFSLSYYDSYTNAMRGIFYCPKISVSFSAFCSGKLNELLLSRQDKTRPVASLMLFLTL